MITGEIKIGSLNCRGLSSDKIKRRDVFHYCRQNYDLIFLIDTHSTEKVEKSWAAEWGYVVKFSSYESNSRGVAILFRNTFQFKILDEIHDQHGNFLILDCELGEQRVALTALYEPNRDEPEFFTNIQRKLDTMETTSIIIGGDFNVPLDYDTDTLNYKQKNNVKSNAEIKNMIDYLDLVDIYRAHNPHVKRFTWRGPNHKQSRLDYFLISSDLAQFTKASSIDIAYKSDHSPVSISMNFTNQQRGKGTWKFNNTLLYDPEYVQIIKDCIHETTLQYTRGDDSLTIDNQLFWETIKLMIRGKTISYASYKKKEREKQETELKETLKTLYDKPLDDDIKFQINEKENLLRQIREEKVKGILLRAKSRWKVEGEKSTRYFCNLEKRHYTEKSMNKIITDEGNEKTNIKEILHEQKLFYERLYRSQNLDVNDDGSNTFFDHGNPYVEKLSPQESIELEGPLTEPELLNSLKSMKNFKSPGIDGFTVEFYKFFWADIKSFLLNSLNYAYESGQLSISQKQGIITCLPKEGKQREFVKNWRPISLLNVDYKLASTCLSIRFQSVMPKLISGTQSGFLKGRDICESTRLIHDLLHNTEVDNIPGLLIMLDFEKAFDTVDRNFIQRTLTFFGFGESICRWTNVFSNDIKSCIVNNGHCSEFLTIGRGVRQGDPLSSHIFLLVVELLAAAIKFHPDIKGIKIDNSEFTIIQYADDTSLTLSDDDTSLNSALSLIDLFSKYSGLNVNYDKTEVVWIGARRGCMDQIQTTKALK